MNDFLFVNPFLHPPGGGEGVANWMVEALAGRGRVTVLCWDPPNFDEIDRYYGTELSSKEIEVVLVAPRVRRWLQKLRIPHHLLRTHWLERRARAMRSSFRHCFSAYNALDLGPPAVQYVHHPVIFDEDGAPPFAWSREHWLRWIWPLYLWGLNRISQRSMERIRNNITIVNSHWTGRAYQATTRGPVHQVIYPPPLGNAPPASSAPRKEAFLSIARVDRSKNWPVLVEILRRVRARGHEVGLTLVGSRYDDRLLEEIQALVRENRSWLSLQLNAPREQLDRLMVEHRYAIHGMIDEHYGMAVAELVLAGCLTFVHDSGGQVEIVPQPQARYSSIDDAVEKIDAVLSNREFGLELAAAQAENRPNLTRSAFLSRFDEFVDRLEAGEPIPPQMP